jgi:hypothetical protein
MDRTEVRGDFGLVEGGVATTDEWNRLIRRQAGFVSFDSDTRHYCLITVPAPWRDTPGPTWHLVAAMLRKPASRFTRITHALMGLES